MSSSHDHGSDFDRPVGRRLPDLVGLWAAKLQLGPELRGPLTMERKGTSWTAEIAGRTAAVAMKGEHLSFDLADGLGGFRGRLMGAGRSARIEGHWIQPRQVSNGMRYATPIVLEPLSADRWRGSAAPLEDEFTFFLPIRRDSSGALETWLGNPDRNIGRFMRVERARFDGKKVQLLGRSSRTGPLEVVERAARTPGRRHLRAAAARRHLRLPSCHRGRRRGVLSAPQDSGAVELIAEPLAEDDGWTVGSLEEVGISREAIAQLVQMLIDMPMDSLRSPQIHAMLIARNGKLVLEEYFHGFHREQLHETRSAAKSITSFLIGATMQRKLPISPATKVYSVMESPTKFAALEPRKRALTLENLLMMSSGLDIDDGDDNSKGNEDTMQSQDEQPDWYRYTLDLKTVRDPGRRRSTAAPTRTSRVACLPSVRPPAPRAVSGSGGRAVADQNYAMDLQPTGEPYMGGGLPGHAARLPEDRAGPRRRRALGRPAGRAAGHGPPSPARATPRSTASAMATFGGSPTFPIRAGRCARSMPAATADKWSWAFPSWT